MRAEFCDTWLDYQIEQEVMKMWEQQEQSAQPLDKVSKDTVLNAWAGLTVARENHFDPLIEKIAKVAEMVMDTPESDRLISICNQLEDLESDYRKLEDELNENWRSR